MSTLTDGINNIHAYTTQIEALRKSAGSSGTANADAAKLAIEQSFNNMLNGLMDSSDDDDDKNSSSDPFGSFMSNNQAYLDLIKQQQALGENSGADSSQ